MALLALLLTAAVAGGHAQGTPPRGAGRAGAPAAVSSPPPAAAQGGSGDWRTARATYYGAPEYIARAYDPDRGEGSFGILAFGSCGYTNSDGSLPFPREAYAAAADGNEDYPGSCGRCYAVRCKPGLVLNNQREPIKIEGGNYEGDKFRPYLPALDPNVSDSRGRPWPGNPAEARGEQAVVCADPGRELVVRIADSCPCTQVLPDGAPGVAPGGETRTQTWCCGGVPHFDLSFDAFEQLAHPVYGVTMLEYRPVDCDTQAPLPFTPGFVSSTLYSGGIKPGWGWQSYRGADFRLTTDEETPAGTASTRATLSPGGGLYFFCRRCAQEGYRPFAGATAFEFWIKARGGGANSTQALPLKLFIRGESDNYCGAEPRLGDLAPSQSARGGWRRYTIPIEAFDCSSLGDMTHVEFQNVNPEGAEGAGVDASFNLGEVRIVK